ncbi:hypothetical protein [Erythrobacter crassostreae]|uniref:Uncharacterized protein n=1 Tax=Erythrobacter crassostreae TaxID=2828328 RepID=A0A9X1F3Z5_9SPHN|nr:hypothetical protein [Erythrobacter crassostrea]MBV7259063.1 hypothetical protein [Erythrobacter crassostrea]
MIWGGGSLEVNGNTVLGEQGIVNVATTQIDQGDIGSTFDVLTEIGIFTHNGATVNVIDNEFLIDYTVNLGSV